MSKTQQCSDWGKRPLTRAQIDYAAADGHSVVRMLDTLVLAKPEAAEQSLLKFTSTEFTPRVFVPRSKTSRKGINKHKGNRAQLVRIDSIAHRGPSSVAGVM